MPLVTLNLCSKSTHKKKKETEEGGEWISRKREPRIDLKKRFNFHRAAENFKTTIVQTKKKEWMST